MHRTLASVAALMLLAGCSVVGIRSGYEGARYEVVENIGESVEIRRYETRLAAETVVAASDRKAGGNQAFKVLFDYISGANRAQSEVAMTTPVETADAEQIAMTVPVETAASNGGRYTMRFFLPASYTRATAPEPTDPRVRIIELSGLFVAALRFSGSWDDESLGAREAELLQALDDSTWQPASAPSALFYDPPWTLSFLRRNEVVVPVER